MAWSFRWPRRPARHERRAPQQPVTPAAAATSPLTGRHRLDPPSEPHLLAVVDQDTVRIAAVPAPGERSGRHSLRAISAARRPGGPSTRPLPLHN